jgi:hypothetical protein
VHVWSGTLNDSNQWPFDWIVCPRVNEGSYGEAGARRVHPIYERGGGFVVAASWGVSEMAWRSGTGLRDVAGRSALGLGLTAFGRRGFILASHAAEKEREQSGGPWAAAGAR